MRRPVRCGWLRKNAHARSGEDLRRLPPTSHGDPKCVDCPPNPPPITEQEGAIAAAAITAVAGQPSRGSQAHSIVVQQEATRGDETMGSVLVWAQSNLGVDHEYAAMLAARWARPGSVWRCLDAGRPYEIASTQLLNEMFWPGIADSKEPSGGAAVGGWDGFKARFPNSFGWLSLTRPAGSDDGRKAVIFVELRCGNLCADGSVVYLLRKENGWEAVHKVRQWQW